MLHGTPWYCCMLPYAARCCPMLPHTAPHCLVLPHAAWCCLVLPHTAACCLTLPHAAWHCPMPPHAAAHYTMLRGTAWHCPTPPHGAPCCCTPLVGATCLPTPTPPTLGPTAPPFPVGDWGGQRARCKHPVESCLVPNQPGCQLARPRHTSPQSWALGVHVCV